MEEVEIQSREGRRKEQLVEQEREQVNQFQQEVRVQFDEVNAELDLVKPMLLEAEKNVQNIDKKGLITIKSF